MMTIDGRESRVHSAIPASREHTGQHWWNEPLRFGKSLFLVSELDEELAAVGTKLETAKTEIHKFFRRTDDYR